MNDQKKQIYELKTENNRLKSEINEANLNNVELTNKLKEKSEKLIQANQLIKKQQAQLIGEERLKATSELVREAIHELTQPLTVIVGCCELLSMFDGLDPKMAKYINSIFSSSKKLSEVVHKIQAIIKSAVREYIDLKEKIKNE